MALIFPKYTDLIVRIAGGVIALGVVSGIGLFAYFSWPNVIDTGYQPTQPVPYSHKLHAGSMGMDCLYCHTTVTRSSYAAIPPTETCMNCHKQVKPTSDILQ